METAFDASVPGMGSRNYQIVAALTAVALAGTLVWSQRRIRALENTIEVLQTSLDEKRAELTRGPPQAGADQPAQLHARKDASPKDAGRGNARSAPDGITGSYQVLKDLDADAATDPRSYAERLQALLADEPTVEEAAIACRFIFDKAADTRNLPDDALQALYASQANPDLKRVIAQVLSQRGNDTLLHDRIAEVQGALKSGEARDRLDALNQLGKIHSVQAVDAIGPMLQDSDSTVRVAALFALRDSGNQRQVSLVEPLLHDPDPSVSVLAANVMGALRNLSSSARTSYSRADIESELPPIASP